MDITIGYLRKVAPHFHWTAERDGPGWKYDGVTASRIVLVSLVEGAWTAEEKGVFSGAFERWLSQESLRTGEAFKHGERKERVADELLLPIRGPAQPATGEEPIRLDRWSLLSDALIRAKRDVTAALAGQKSIQVVVEQDTGSSISFSIAIDGSPPRLVEATPDSPPVHRAAAKRFLWWLSEQLTT